MCTHNGCRPTAGEVRLSVATAASGADSPNDTGPSSSRQEQEEEDIQEEHDQLDQFARSFKRRRIELGFTQRQAGIAMGKRFGIAFSQGTVSRFETADLTSDNMKKLKPLFERWLQDADADADENPHRQEQEGS